MKKIYYITLIFPFALFAQSFLISNIELPRVDVQNLDPYPCDEECLKEYLENDFIFSFLAHANSKLEDQELEEIRQKYIVILNLKSKIISKKLRIALLLPYNKIGRYAASTTNASFAYLMAKNRPFELKSYKIENESHEEILKALRNIQKDEFYYVIAPLTQEGEDVVSKINPEIDIYFPTINKKDANTTSKYLYYGGIDYRAQSDLLLNEAESPLVIFNDESTIAKTLSDYQEDKFYKQDITNENKIVLNSSETYTQETAEVLDEQVKVIKFSIPKRTTNLEKRLKENSDINEGSFFINTPIIKSGMIMSQLTLYDTNATNILSTQTNYNPLLLSMTQYQDRKNMIVANSIIQNKDVLIEINSLLGNDIVYDWINYTTTVGIDYFFHHISGEDREYNIDIKENQMIYKIELLQPSVSRFIPYYSTFKQQND
jgi:SRSO17 transposase